MRDLALVSSWPVCRATCMQPGGRDLAAEVSDLRTQVAELTSLVRGLVIQGASQASSQWELLSEPPTQEPAAPSHSQSYDYDSLADSIPEVPEFCLRACGVLRGGTLSSHQRASRAWEAGSWARFCLEGKIAKPRPSLPCDVANAYYVVLRCEGFSCPLFCDKASDYRSVVQDFKGNSLSHGFASLAEAKVYCWAAGFELPSKAYRWSSRQ